jgi:hypothetical protein
MDPLALGMRELARIDAEDLAGRIDWDGLIREHTFTTVANTVQAGALPDDFGRFPFRQDDRGELYDVARRDGLAGPTNDHQWRRVTNGFAGWTTGWRTIGGVLQMAPAPPAGLTISFSYVSKHLFELGVVGSEDWTSDADVCRIPESLITLGVIWRWKQAKGYEYAEDMRTAELAVERAAGSTRGRRMLTIGTSRLRADDFAYPWALGQ